MLSTTGWIVLLVIFAFGAFLVALPRLLARRDDGADRGA
jgi:hypothetical protein